MKARANTAMDAALERYTSVYGNIENVAGDFGDAALAAFEELVWAVPTSVRGVRALLSYLSEDVDDLGRQLDDGKLKTVLCSIDEALEAIHPAV